MSIYESALWLNDLDEVISSCPIISELEGKSVLITGVAGLICSAFTDLLIRYNETHEKKIIIIAAGRHREVIKRRFGDYFEKDYFFYVPFDASSPDNQISLPCDYIIHGASNASPELIIKEPVETMMSNVLGMKCLLDHARDCEAKRVLYISSSEVYGKKENDQPYSEQEYGFIDILNSRSSYSISKRAAETLCVSYAAEFGVDSVIVRPGHIYGPTASPSDNRVSSAWAYLAAQGNDIVMKSDGLQKRSYCYCVDCASAILYALLRGSGCNAYNISNPDSILTIKQMAETISEVGNVKVVSELPSEIEKKGFNPMNNSSLQSDRLIALGWKGMYDADCGFDHTVRIIKEMLGKDVQNNGFEKRHYT